MNFKVLLGYAAPYRLSLAIASALMLLETAAALAVPWFGGEFVRHLLVDSHIGVVAVLLVLLGLFAIQALLKFANGYILARTSEHILADLRIRVYDHLQALPLDFYHARRKGDILALLTHEVTYISNYITGTLLSLLPLLITAGGAVVLMFTLDPLLAAFAALSVPLFYLLLKTAGRRLRPLAVQLQKADAAAVATAEENLGMLPAIKAFAREDIEAEHYRTQVYHVRQLTISQQRIFATLEPVVQFIAAAAVICLLWFASRRVADGGMTAAEMVSFFLYGALLTRPVSALANVYGRTQKARGALQRMHEVLNEEREGLFGGAQSLPIVRGDVEFRDVTFGYTNRPLTLERLNLRIRAGEILAITGKNGVGKSTLAHLLIRLHEPQSGKILIDSIDITSVSLRSLRSQIGLVPQNVFLFNGTIAANIGYGRSGAGPSQIVKAAKLAQAHEFIIDLPEGYQTVIGDHGVKLSGGQRQRIALARALLKDPPILILDEATAMFDAGAEQSFIRDCREALVDRTVLLITHRPASLALAHRAIRLECGRAQIANINDASDRKSHIEDGAQTADQR